MRVRLCIAAVAVGVLTLVGNADVILHPGTVTGTSGLTNWTFNTGSVSLSQNVANGLSGSVTVSGAPGAAYTLTVEGAQTYTSIGQSFTSYSPYTGFSMSRQVSLAVPQGGTVAGQDLLTPGGTIQVNTTVTAAAGASASISNVDLYSYGQNAAGTDYYSAYAYTSGATVTLPMAAATGISVYGYIYVSLTDAQGTCTVYQSIPYPYPTVDVTEGNTATIDVPVDVSADSCTPAATGTILGTISLSDQTLTPFSAQVRANGAAFQSLSITSNPFPYLFANLPTGYYTMQTIETFGSNPQSYLIMNPSGGQISFNLSAGGSLQADFTYDLAQVSGNFGITGPLASALSDPTNSYAYASETISSTDPYGTGNYANGGGMYVQGYSGNPMPSLPAPFATELPAGSWRFSSFSAQLGGNNGSLYLSLSDPNAPPFTVNGGDTLSQDVSVATSQGDLVFDVDEQGGPTITISSPSISINSSDASGRSVYISAGSYAQNQATPVVHVVGPPGQYPFSAYATVQGSSVTFPAGTITLGQGTNTSVGTNEQVTLLDQNGNPTNVQLTFANVTGAGQTNVTFITSGPVPPGGFTLMPAFNGATYLDITTTATFTGNVIVALRYDPVALGLTPATEGLLQLWHYHCDASGSNCQWEYINGGHAPDPDTVNHVIYGVDTDGFSNFALLLPNQTSTHPPTVTCVGSASNPKVIATSAGLCNAPIDNTIGLAGSCAGGGGGLASCTFDGQASEYLMPGVHQVTVTGAAADGSSAQCTSYIDIVDMQSPSITCPAPTTVECTGSTTPLMLTAVASDNCAVANTSCSGGPFGLGTTGATCVASDAAGNSNSCQTSVVVVDTKAPTLSLTVSPTVLWPPDHRLVPIAISSGATDVCDPHPVVSCSVTSNDTDRERRGDVDIVWRNGRLFLAAERQEDGQRDRVYTISCKATDASGNASVKTATVVVPHDQGRDRDRDRDR
jgi:hypothetical protein